jgi:hypothetical protein
MAERGYHGGRIMCHQGCTSIWLIERIEREAPVIPVEARGHHQARTIVCCRCHKKAITHATNTIRCEPCRDAWRRAKSRESSRRHVLKQAALRRAIA